MSQQLHAIIISDVLMANIQNGRENFDYCLNAYLSYEIGQVTTVTSSVENGSLAPISLLTMAAYSSNILHNSDSALLTIHYLLKQFIYYQTTIILLQCPTLKSSLKNTMFLFPELQFQIMTMSKLY